MWFWSVSWLTNCPVFSHFFWSTKNKIVQSQGIFGQSLGFFCQPKKNLVDQKKFGRPKKILVYQKEIWSTKNSQRLTKNSLRLDNFFFGRPKKMRKRPDNWSAKRLTKATFSKKTGQKIQESDQKRSETGQIFFWLTKKNEK